MTDGAPERIDIAEVLARCSLVLGKRLSALTPDAVARAADSLRWRPLPAWEKLSDTEIATATGLLQVFRDDELCVVTEAALAKGHGVFVVAATELRRLISDHLGRYGECFFNGDILIVNSDGTHLWLFHHEGQHAEIHRMP